MLALAGCATSDGGVGGTGIATVRGNVLDPELTPVTLQQVAGNGASAAGITVQVRGTSVTDETDEAGVFELSGAIAGEITIDFMRDNHPVAVTEHVIVPVDAEITLKDIALLDSVAAPEVIEVDNVIATVVDAPICNADGSGSFMLRDEGGLTFAVEVTPETVITDTRGALDCADVTEESEVKFRGVQADGNISASDLRVLKLGRPSLAS
jgi:hypothetical protein